MNRECTTTTDGKAKGLPLAAIADALASAAVRIINRVAAPMAKPLGLADQLSHVMPFVPMLLDAFRPFLRDDADGPTVKQLRREFAAEEARLQAEHAARLATLTADFGPKFLDAAACDTLVERADAHARSAA